MVNPEDLIQMICVVGTTGVIAKIALITPSRSGSMICKPCREDAHDKCDATEKDRTWCDCQHKPQAPVVTEDA